jgi:hypothetical protein
VTSTELDKIQFYCELDKPYGFTYGEWTTKWWDWILPIPRENSPLHDDTGALWITNQPSSDVWFLIGNFAKEFPKEYPTEKKNFPHRKIKIKAGRSILVPILNCMATLLEYPDLKTHEGLLKHVENDVNSIVKKKLFINEKMYEPIRVPSDPNIFKVKIIENNAFDIKNLGLTDAAADGYWAFIKPLSKGNYIIRFEGSCENGRLSAGASYNLEIV